MASRDEQATLDSLAIEKHREKFGDAEGAKFATQVYILRQTQAATSNTGFGRFPRGVVILLAIWFALLETADKVPQLLLSLPKFEAALAEYQAKPELTRLELKKARYDMQAAMFQPVTALSNYVANGSKLGMFLYNHEKMGPIVDVIDPLRINAIYDGKTDAATVLEDLGYTYKAPR